MSLLGTFFLYMEGLHAHMATAPLPEPPATFVTEGRLLSHQKEKLPEEWWWFGGPVSFFIFASMASGIHGTLRLNTRVFTFIHVRSHVCFMHLSSIPLFQSPIQTAVYAVYAVYAEAGHFKQQQFRAGRSTLLNTNTLMSAL
jgi:hypothetical protein